VTQLLTWVAFATGGTAVGFAAIWLFIGGVQRIVDRRYDQWGIRTDQQARTKGCVAVEDPTGGDET
jgi:hypothetical protein